MRFFYVLFGTAEKYINPEVEHRGLFFGLTINYL